MPEPLSLTEASAWVGADLAALDGPVGAQVDGFFVDREGGAPVYLIARSGRRRRSRVVAVPIDTCAGAPFGAWAACEGEEIRSAPVVDPSRPLRREHELAICSHFGINEAVGRAAAVAARAEGEITATPPLG